MKRLVVVATGNPGKVREFARAFEQEGFEFRTQRDVGFLEDVDENGKIFAENARIKAVAVAKYLKDRELAATVIADDSGLEVKALDGAPGIHSARFAGVHGDSLANNEKLLRELKCAADRSARFVTALCVIDEAGFEHYVEGECRGRILEDFRGTEGFGYDPLFVPEGHERTFAEMSIEEKQSLSHRGRAIENLKALKLL